MWIFASHENVLRPLHFRRVCVLEVLLLEQCRAYKDRSRFTSRVVRVWWAKEKFLMKVPLLSDCWARMKQLNLLTIVHSFSCFSSFDIHPWYHGIVSKHDSMHGILFWWFCSTSREFSCSDRVHSRMLLVNTEVTFWLMFWRWWAMAELCLFNSATPTFHLPLLQSCNFLLNLSEFTLKWTVSWYTLTLWPLRYPKVQRSFNKSTIITLDYC